MQNRTCSKISTIVVGLLVAFAVSACAKTRVDDRHRLVNEPLARPGQILVYDFAATPGDVPPDSLLARNFEIEGPAQTPAHIAEGRALGAQIAAELVKEIRAMGMPATHAGSGSVQPQLNDIVIRGYLVSVKEGSAAKRVTIGFGSGASELRTAVEGLQMTPAGLRTLGYGSVQAGGGKSPGAAVGAIAFIATANPAGLIVSSGMKVAGEATGGSKLEGRAKATAEEIADVLKARFKEQGWI